MNPYTSKAGGPKDAKLKKSEKKLGKYKGTENKRYASAKIGKVVDTIGKTISSVAGGSKSTDKAQKGYAKRRKNIVDTAVKKQGG